MQRDQDPGEPHNRDRRQEDRHEVQRACLVTPAATAQGEMSGITTNVSRSGMLVSFPGFALSEMLPRVGEFARILIELPKNVKFGQRALECGGRVVRAEADRRESPQLAFEIHTMKIRTRPAGRAPRKRNNADRVQ